MSTQQDKIAPEKVPDLPCPKCGGGDVHFSYMRGCHPSMCKDAMHREHFKRYCRRCSYEWLTFDVLAAADEGTSL